MKTLSAKGIVLGHKNFGEFDKLIFLYCEELGKIKAIAKGARRITSKFTGHLETLNIIQCQLYFGPKNIILTEILEPEKSSRSLQKGNFDTISGALQIAEITNDVLYENQPLENLIKLIEKTISHLSSTEKPTLISIAYITKLLDKIGVIPDYKTTRTEIPEKFEKLLQYLKIQSLSKIEKIAITPKETFQITKIIKEIIEQETEKEFKSFLS